jgi:archaemetzincin
MKKHILSLIILLVVTGIFSFNSINPVVKHHKSIVIKEKLKINITVMGDVKNEDVELVKSELIKFYNAEVVILPKTNLLTKTKVVGLDKYNANKILNNINRLYLDKTHKVLMLTNVDICTDRELNGVVYKNWGIFGLGQLNKKPCVVSTHRFKTNYKDKLIKVSIHEIGHTLNIPHCNSNKCIMNDAKGKGSNVDKELLDMCNLCKSKIRY